MVVLVTIETIVLALMAVLLLGLLRSHAEILRRLERLSPQRADQGELLPPARADATPAFDITGTTIDGDAVKFAMASPATGGTLLAFLSTGCSTCGSFWEGLGKGFDAELPGSPRVLVVTKDTSHESPSKLRELT